MKTGFVSMLLLFCLLLNLLVFLLLVCSVVASNRESILETGMLFLGVRELFVLLGIFDLCAEAFTDEPCKGRLVRTAKQGE